MHKYIDAKIAENMLLDGYDVDEIPAADVAPVRHAHWIFNKQISENCLRYNCSDCNRWVQDGAGKNPSDRFPYCHCGAKMDEKENEK